MCKECDKAFQTKTAYNKHMNKKHNKGGRPTKFDLKYNDELIEFFSIPPTREIEVTKTDKKGNQYSTYEIVPNELPTFGAFAHKINVNLDTLNEWQKESNKEKYPRFSESYKRAKTLQKNFLIQNGLSGKFNSTFSIFVAKNITDMRDNKNLDITSDGEPIKGIQYIVLGVVFAKNPTFVLLMFH
jgi:hypothetical protein